MGKFVNPFTDVGFKILFGQEVSKPMLLHLLNTLLEGERTITDITFLDKEQPAEFKDDRSLIYDILCKTDNIEKIIVEMQNRGQPNFSDRCLYYYSQAVSRQGEKGDEWDYHISAVYLIAFLNFRMKELGDNLRTDIKLINVQTNEVFSDKERFIFLQMPCFTKEAKECETFYERWIYVIKNMAVLDRMPWAAKDSVFQRLAKIAEVRNLTKDERARYDASLKRYRDTLNVMKGAIEEGEEKGLKKGRAEGKAEVAKKMLELDVPIASIMQFTGLTKEEIQALQVR